MISTSLRVIGDVHGQIDSDDLCTRDAQAYLEIIAEAQYSIQLGDMGDAETYDKLIARVDPRRHRFLPGNHEQYHQLPPHSLGDFGSVCWGGVDLFFVRGARSADRETLVQLGRDLGNPVWFEEEELTDQQMHAAEQQYLQARPQIVLSHDAPTHVAGLAWHHARQMSPPNSRAMFGPSRTSDFLQRLLEHHRPRLWLFGHHHHDWSYRQGGTRFTCLGELCYLDLEPARHLGHP